MHQIQKYNPQNLPTIQQKKLLTEQSLMIGAWARTDTQHKIALSFSEKKIADYTNKDMNGIVRLLGEWWMLSGVNTEANAKDLIVMAKFVQMNFSHLTYTDIQLTMNMAIKGELDLDFEPYVRLSASFISKCINNYLQIKARVVNDAAAKTDEYYKRKELEKTPTPTTPEQKMEAFKGILESAYRMAHESSIVYDFESRIYAWLRATKQVKMDKNDVDDALKKGRERYSKVYGFDAKKQPDENIIKKFGREHVVVTYMQATPLTKIFDYLNIEYFK
jgi:hypothetical protein